jgi:hypothetical protein
VRLEEISSLGRSRDQIDGSCCELNVTHLVPYRAPRQSNVVQLLECSASIKDQRLCRYWSIRCIRMGYIDTRVVVCAIDITAQQGGHPCDYGVLRCVPTFRFGVVVILDR